MNKCILVLYLFQRDTSLRNNRLEYKRKRIEYKIKE